MALRDYVEWYGRYPIPASHDRTRSSVGAWDPRKLPDASELWRIGRQLLVRLLNTRDRRFRLGGQP